MPLWTTRRMGFMSSVATMEATRDSTGDGGSVVSFFCRFEGEAAALASAPDHFLEDAPSRVFTILRFTKKKIKRQKGSLALRGKRLEK